MSLEQGLALYPVRDDSPRRSALLQVESDANRFRELEERFRGDPDIALAAIASQASAVESVPRQLREDRRFALEVARRNRRALQLLPESLRAEPAGASGSTYQGEGLRLVGFCNKWRTTDSELRLRAAPLASDGRAAEQDGGVRHWNTVHLHNGCLSFQLVSCTREFSFRIFPAGAPKDGYYRLANGEEQAVGAALGGSDDGHGRNFYIDERAGAVVTIYAKVPLGRLEGATVWYTLEGYAPVAASAFRKDAFPVSCPLTAHGLQFLYQGSIPLALPSLAQRPSCQKPEKECPQDEVSDQRRVEVVPLPSTQHRWMILVNPEVEGKRYDELVSKARSLSKASFARRFYARDLAGARHLALLVDMACKNVFAYCLCRIERSCNIFWLEQCAVSDDMRGRGLAGMLATWAQGWADRVNCGRVQVRDANTAAAFELAEIGLLRLVVAAHGGAELRAEAGAVDAEATEGGRQSEEEGEGALLCRLPEGTPLATAPLREGSADAPLRVVWPVDGWSRAAETRQASAARISDEAWAAAELFRLMHRVRVSVAGSFPHSQCMRTAQALLSEVRRLGLEKRLGRSRCDLVEGRFTLTAGRSRANPHCYLKFDDGTIADATADQFGRVPQLWWPAEPAHYS